MPARRSPPRPPGRARPSAAPSSLRRPSSPIGLACSSSCAHDATSESSSRVPSPPGRAMKPSASSAIIALRSWSDADHVQLGQPGVRQLAIDQPARDHPDHLATGGQRRVGQGAHQPDPAAAVDDPDAPLGEPPSDRPGQLAVALAPTGARAAEHADPAHGQNPSSAQARCQPSGGPGAVRDGVLLGRRPQPQRPTAGRLGCRLEDRVVAKAARPARLGGDPAAARPARPDELERRPRAGAIRQGHRQDADVARGPRVRAAGRAAPPAVERCSSASVACSPAYRRVRTPGPAVERVDLDPGVVGQGRQAGGAQPRSGP